MNCPPLRPPTWTALTEDEGRAGACGGQTESMKTKLSCRPFNFACCCRKDSALTVYLADALLETSKPSSSVVMWAKISSIYEHQFGATLAVVVLVQHNSHPPPASSSA